MHYGVELFVDINIETLQIDIDQLEKNYKKNEGIINT